MLERCEGIYKELMGVIGINVWVLLYSICICEMLDVS